MWFIGLHSRLGWMSLVGPLNALLKLFDSVWNDGRRWNGLARFAVEADRAKDVSVRARSCHSVVSACEPFKTRTTLCAHLSL